MNKLIFSLSTICLINSVQAQLPDTDIYLIDITASKKETLFGKPLNITNKPGYDNQPTFSPDNNRILYVSMDDTIQSDIYEYDIQNKINKRTAQTPESEYSPTFIPNFGGISIVRVDADKAQRLYKYSSTPLDAEIIIEGVDSVGYHKWINDSTLALVVLNNGLELHIYELYSQQFIVVAKNVGRNLLIDPESGKLLYTQSSSEATAIMALNLESYESELYCYGYKDSKDFAFTPSGELWTGYEGKLYALDMKNKREWIQRADFSKTVGNFYRLAISSNGKYLALVSYSEKRP